MASGLSKIKDSLEKKFGSNSVMYASEIPGYETFSSGSLSLDYATGIGGFPTNRVIELAGQPGAGKALALDTPIPTPDGWTTMGSLSVGDFVFDESGKQVRVIGVYEVPNPNGTFEVKFNDHSRIVACGDHLWTTLGGKKKATRSGLSEFPENWPVVFGETVSTNEIAMTLQHNQRNNHSIPVAKPIECEDEDLPIEPWVLGYWLGNGNTAEPRVTCASNDAQDIRGLFARFGQKVGPTTNGVKPSAETFSLLGATEKFREMGLIGNKHVPYFYLRASVSQRKELLAGLLDSDGFIDKSGRVDFDSTLKHLTDSVFELAASLGQKPVRTQKEARIGEKSYGLTYKVSWNPTFDPFFLPRKSKRFRGESAPQGIRRHHRFIVSVEKIPDVPMKCIQVDSPNKLYLAGESMIPTHNTTMALHAVNNRLKLEKKKGTGRGVVYIDQENRLTDSWVNRFVEDDDKVIVVKPDTMEQATDIYRDAVTTGEIAMVVMDSIGGAPTQRVTEKSAESGNFGGNALAVSRFASFAMAMSGKFDVTTLGLNQVREDMTGYSRLVTPGGQAWKHACSLRIELKRGKDKIVEKIGEEELQVGYSVAAKIHKNSLAAPFRACWYYFLNVPTEKYGFGVDRVDEIVRLALLTGAVTRVNQVTYEHPKLGKVRGREAVISAIKANEELQEELAQEVMAKLAEGNTAGVTTTFDEDAPEINVGPGVDQIRQVKVDEETGEIL